MPTIEEIRAYPEHETQYLGPRGNERARAAGYSDGDIRELGAATLHGQNSDWALRESSRMRRESQADKHYTRLPEIWYDWLHPWHFAHRAEKDPTQIAFTKTTRKGFADVQTVMKPGRYLTEYYSDRFSSDEIRDLVRELTPAIYQIARTPQEIARIYEMGPRSCMSGTEWYRATRYTPVEETGEDEYLNPVIVYATEDVGVAYIEQGDRVTARAVVNMQANEFGRVYGDNRLEDALESDGFVQNGHCLRGCRLRKIPMKDSTNQHYYAMPYLDGISCLVERGDYLVAVPDYPDPTWERWGVDSNELISMGGTQPVTQQIMFCALTNRRVPRTTTAWRVVEEADDSTYRLRVSPTGGFINLRRIVIDASLQHTHTWRHASTGRPILCEPNHSVVALDNGNKMFAEEARHFAARCWLTNKLVHQNDLVEVAVGYTLNDDGTVDFNMQRVLNSLAFDCTHSGRYWAITEQTCMANGTVISKYALSRRKNMAIDAYTGLLFSKSGMVRIARGRYANRSTFRQVGYTCPEGEKYLSYIDYLQSQQTELPMAAE